MQFLKLSTDLITDENLTANELRIYMYLLSLYNEAKKCSYPSMEVIAEKTHTSLSTVKRSIAKLIELGYMTVEKRKGLAGNFNIYKELKHLIGDKISNKKAENKEDNQNICEENKVENEAVKPLVVSDCKESGLQMTIDEVEEVKFKNHANNSKIAKETNIELTPFFCEAFSHIDETILEMALREGTKTATLLLKKCIRLTKSVGLEFDREFINKVLKIKSYEEEWKISTFDGSVLFKYDEIVSAGLHIPSFYDLAV